MQDIAATTTHRDLSRRVKAADGAVAALLEIAAAELPFGLPVLGVADQTLLLFYRELFEHPGGRLPDLLFSSTRMIVDRFPCQTGPS